MPAKNIILNSLKESFAQIFKNKFIFFLLTALQIIFFIIFFFISSIYVPAIQQHSKAMFDYLNEQKLDDVSLTQNILQQKSILGDDPLSLSTNLSEVIKNSRIYLAYTFILMVFFTSIIWAITNRLIYEKKILSSKFFFKIFIVVFFYLAIIFLFFFSILNISFTEAAYNTSLILGKYLLFFLVSVILLYFMFISLSLANKTELKDIVQNTLSIGIKKIHYMLAVYFTGIFFVLLALFFLVYFLDTNFLIVVLAMIMLVFSILFSRILMLNVVEKLDNL